MTPLDKNRPSGAQIDEISPDSEQTDVYPILSCNLKYKILQKLKIIIKDYIEYSKNVEL
ncbi:hypothetical protein SATMO3_20770 [Sporomusa aerivorans]